ncbi:MAG: pantetheine-phosphate adenylyltransferase [Acidobacteriota bacterium]
MNRIGVYPGSFDPLHNGHLDIIRRCRPLFDEVVVAVLLNTSKRNPLWSVEERVSVIEEVVASLDGCRVATFSGLLVDFMDQLGARTIVRGLRAMSDFETEFQMALMNRRLDARIETVFLTPKEEYSYVSSRLVKEVYLLGGDCSQLLPPQVLRRLPPRRREATARDAGA